MCQDVAEYTLWIFSLAPNMNICKIHQFTSFRGKFVEVIETGPSSRPYLETLPRKETHMTPQIFHRPQFFLKSCVIEKVEKCLSVAHPTYNIHELLQILSFIKLSITFRKFKVVSGCSVFQRFFFCTVMNIKK
jgi:hypothetical protein